VTGDIYNPILDERDKLNIRCVEAREPNEGWALKRGREVRRAAGRPD